MEKNLQQLFDKYINECESSRGLRPETIKGYRAVFGHFSTMVPEAVSVKSLTVDSMNDFFARIKKRTRIVGRDTIKTGLEDSTIKTYGNKLNAFFVWLMQRELLLKNPLDNIRLKYPQYNDQRALTQEEVNKIISAVTLHPGIPLMFKRNTVMISLLFFCGLRAGEFIAIQGRDIDMVKRTLTVRAETSKSKRSRIIPMNLNLVRHLEEYIRERNKCGYKTEYLIVSTSKDRGLTRHGLKHWVKRLVKLSGVKFHLHRFRHSFACNLAKCGTPILKIRDLMGHKSIRMTEVYLRSMMAEDAREDIDRLTI